MVAQALVMMETVFGAVVGWFTDLMTAVEGSNFVIAGFMIVLVVGVLFIPLRGSALGAIGDGISDLTQNTIHKEKTGYFSKSRNHKQMEQKRYIRERNKK